MSHTPGPWKVVASEDDPYGAIEIKAEFRTVCCLGLDDAPVPDYNATQLRNARLIAAAPELLEALEACERRLSRMNKMFNRDEEWKEVSQAAAAIRKARGE